ncbi:uncharacterized protein LOC121391348, partial [Gigantopelta aegis]|uniref:uncharacterized protein LOC121391348 n=1 Tax=Gigantopelta aegis TaxID=1735272 RepID=UPI001B88B49A
MKKDHIYKINLVLDKETLDIAQAECGCPAGKGPHASHKHIAALCYALEEFSRFGKLPDFLTSTERLQQWNKPRPKKLEIMPVAELTSRKSDILQRNKKSNMNGSYDPHLQNTELLKGWLGASPDGKIKDLTSQQSNGVIEVKCPYTKRDCTPEVAC